MDDVQAAQQAIEGTTLIIGALWGAVPAAITAGVTALASAAAYFFGVKHERKRARKNQQNEEIEGV